MNEVSRVRVSGPLAAHVSELVGHLVGRGYGNKSTVEHLRRLAQMSRWLEQRQLDPSAVDEQLLGEWISALQATGAGRTLTLRSFRVVLGFLRSQGVVPERSVALLTPVEVLVERYAGYLLVERSLMPMTVKGYVATATSFLEETCADDPGRVVALSARDVARFVVAVGRVRSPRSVNEAVVGVRSLLRYFYANGLIPTPLAQAPG